MSEHTEEELRSLLELVKRAEVENENQRKKLSKMMQQMIQKEIREGNLSRRHHPGEIGRIREQEASLAAKLNEIKSHKDRIEEELEHRKSTGGESKVPHKEIDKITTNYNIKPNNKSSSNIGSGAKKVGGAIVGAGAAIWAIGKSLGSKKDSTGYKDPNDRSALNGLIFMVFFLFIVIYEMLGGGYFNNIDVIRFFYAIVFLVWGWFSLPEERSSVWMVFIYTLFIPMIFAIFAGMPFFSQSITNATIYHTLMLFTFPAILYFMLFSEGARLPKFFGIFRLLLIVSILVLALGFTESADVINRLQQTGGDTGFSLEKALQGISGGFSGFGTSFLEPLVCALNPNCGFNNWLTSITEPFASDATTVHEIQNKNLGLYVERVNIPSNVDVTGLQYTFLPEPISFYIRAPIPPKLGYELCNIDENGLKGFAGICDRNIEVKCEVQDSGGTRIIPDDQLTIGNMIAGRSTAFSCRVASPRLGTKKVNLSVQYPFVTNTYKLLRAVEAEQVNTIETANELDKLPSSYIISTGGPVIIESDESDFIAVRETGTKQSLLIRLRAQDQVRLVSVLNMELYLPSGMTLVESEDPLCDFVHFAKNDSKTPDQFYEDCKEKAYEQIKDHPTITGTITSLEEACTSYIDKDGNKEQYNMERTANPACNMLDECVQARDNYAYQKNQSHDNVYSLSRQAISKINIDLQSPVKQKTKNDIAIPCEVEIDREEFLQGRQTHGVYERALNIVSYFVAEHQATGTIRFSGTQSPISRVTYSDLGDQICNDKTTGLSVPIGTMPISEGTPKLTFEYGSNDDPLGRGQPYTHKGIDMASRAGDEIVSAWDGNVFALLDGCEVGTKCGSGYGNHVIIESTDNKGKVFHHIYAHLQKGSVENNGLKKGDEIERGTPLGKQGNTGDSTGSHLHFEVRVGGFNSGKNMNPLPCIDHAKLQQTEKYNESIRIAMAGVTMSYPSVGSLANFPSAESIEKFIEGLEEIGQNERAIMARKISEEALVEGVKPELAIAIAIQESNLNHFTASGQVQVSGTGAIGIMQIIPSTGRDICSDSSGEWKDKLTIPQVQQKLRNLDTNIMCGIQVIKEKEVNFSSCQQGQDCDCTIRRRIDGITVPISVYNNDPYYGVAQAYVGWSCRYHPHYVEDIYTKLLSIMGKNTPQLPTPST